MITIEQALTRAASQLAAHPALFPTALPDAASLLMHLLQIERPELIAHPERVLNRDQQAVFQRLIEQRLRFEPIQYIIGYTYFYGLTLRVTPDVLIPRPETEHLVQAVLDELKRQEPLHIADVGTGSGAIAIALASNAPTLSVTALDLSPAALAIARENTHQHHLNERITLLESDLLSALPDDLLFDAVVSNPPYVSLCDFADLHPQVRDYEPAMALFAGEDGLDFYRRLIPQARSHLKPGGLLALEIGHGQRSAIASLLHTWSEIRFIPDLQQIPRVVLARRPV